MMLYESLKLSPKPQKIVNPFCRNLRIVQGVLPGNQRITWGIDPGVNFGLTVIEHEKVFVMNGALIQDDQLGRYGLLAYKFLQSIINKFDEQRQVRLVIEGASYGDQYGQVLLSEIRTGFYLAGALNTFLFSEIVIKPPMTIRKLVFDNGRTQAGDIFPLLNHNAADSLAMALYAAQYAEV